MPVLIAFWLFPDDSDTTLIQLTSLDQILMKQCFQLFLKHLTYRQDLNLLFFEHFLPKSQCLLGTARLCQKPSKNSTDSLKKLAQLSDHRRPSSLKFNKLTIFPKPKFNETKEDVEMTPFCSMKLLLCEIPQQWARLLNFFFDIQCSCQFVATKLNQVSW